MPDALINGLAGASGRIIAQRITYPLQTVNFRDLVFFSHTLFLHIYVLIHKFDSTLNLYVLFIDLILQVNTRQQTDRDP